MIKKQTPFKVMKLKLLNYEEKKHREQVASLWSIAFRGGGPYTPDEKLVSEDAQAIVAYLHDTLVGAYRVLDLSATRERTRLKVGGIAGVAIKLEYRKKGLGSQLMHSAINLLYENKVHLSALYAFKESYYRTFGFECVGTRYHIKCAPQNFPRVTTSLPIHQISYQDFQCLQPAYESFAKRYNGMNLPRHPARWKALLSVKHKEPLIFTVGDPIAGYAVFRLTENFWQDQPIAEVVWTTPEAYQALLGLFASLGINRSAILWHEPADSPFLISYRDRGVSVESKHPVMFRVVHLPSALQALQPSDKGDFTIRIADPLLKENEGPWRIHFDENHVSIEKTTKAELETDIRSFTQGLLGEPSFKTLARNGMLSVHQQKALDALLRLCPPGFVYCLDVY